jgi:hypothetical protein
MTSQQVFDTVLNGLRKQGVRSISFNERTGMDECAYRGNNGTKCAAGFLIPDEKYDPIFEFKGWWQINFQFPELGEHSDLITLLQQAHDGSCDIDSNWECWMKMIAQKRELVYTPKEEAGA